MCINYNGGKSRNGRGPAAPHGMPVFITTNTNYSLILLVCLIRPVGW